MNYKTIGIVGIIIFALFIIGFSTFLFLINPDFYHQFNGISIATYNIDYVIGVNWVRYFNYILIGVLMVIFSLGIFLKSKKSMTNKTASIFLILSGLIWTSFGIKGHTNGSDFETIFLILRVIVCLSFGALGFLLFGNELEKINHSIKTKWIIFSLGTLILINGLVDFFMSTSSSFDYPTIMSYFSWIIYFSGFAILGISILYRQVPNKI